METSVSQIELLEQERKAPLTPIQREALLAKIKVVQEAATALRRVALPEGGGEPCTLFRP